MELSHGCLLQIFQLLVLQYEYLVHFSMGFSLEYKELFKHFSKLFHPLHLQNENPVSSKCTYSKILSHVNFPKRLSLHSTGKCDKTIGCVEHKYVSEVVDIDKVGKN